MTRELSWREALSPMVRAQLEESERQAEVARSLMSREARERLPGDLRPARRQGLKRLYTPIGRE